MKKIIKIFSLLCLFTTSMTSCGFQPVYNAKNISGNSTISDFKIYSDNKEIEKILSNLIIRSTQTLKSNEQFFLEIGPLISLLDKLSKKKSIHLSFYKVSWTLSIYLPTYLSMDVYPPTNNFKPIF